MQKRFVKDPALDLEMDPELKKLSADWTVEECRFAARLFDHLGKRWRALHRKMLKAEKLARIAQRN